MRVWVLAWVTCACGMCAHVALAQTAPSTRPTAKVTVGAAPDVESKTLTRDRAKSTTQPIAKTGAKTGAQPASPFDVRRVITALAIVLSLIFIMRWGGKRLFPQSAGQRASRAVNVLARNVISPKQQLLVIQVGKRLIVVGDSGQQMNALCEITDPDEAAALIGQIEGERREPIAIGKTFGALFGRADSQYGLKDAPPAEQGDEESDSASASATRDELHGLMDRVRLMSQQFRRT